jgi:nucleoside-diphosphate kinase
MATTDRTFFIVKPDAVQRGLTGEIISRLEAKGLKLVGLKLLQPDRALAEKHYEALKEKPFYPGLIEFITSSPVVAGVVEGPNAVKALGQIVGATNPLDAAPGTIRGDHGISVGPNLIHRSDAPETAEREINLWFKSEELFSWTRANDAWMFEE